MTTPHRHGLIHSPGDEKLQVGLSRRTGSCAVSVMGGASRYGAAARGWGRTVPAFRSELAPADDGGVSASAADADGDVPAGSAGWPITGQVSAGDRVRATYPSGRTVEGTRAANEASHGGFWLHTDDGGVHMHAAGQVRCQLVQASPRKTAALPRPTAP